MRNAAAGAYHTVVSQTDQGAGGGIRTVASGGRGYHLSTMVRLAGRLPIILLLILLAGGCASDDETVDMPATTEDTPSSTDAPVTTAASTTTTDISPDDVVSVTPHDIPDEPAPDASAAPPEGERQLAMVADVQFIILESFPMQVNVEVSGDLPSPCHEVWSEVDPEGTRYDVSVWAVLPAGTEACAAVIEPFTHIVQLGEGFEFGDYTVVVNGESHTLGL